MGPPADLFTQPVRGAAWKTRPTYHIVGTEDRTIQPDLQRFLAKRMKATVTELASSHVPMLSQPRRVHEVIGEAADAVQQSAWLGNLPGQTQSARAQAPGMSAVGSGHILPDHLGSIEAR